ncbi:TPA: hypothetical protein HA278_01155 [Candidatus Woesearchaeota archaeon]|nr:hypothetical protein [Candidatus Woesearchaeota archaeon]|tara:strand:- start:440 stop:889 length:450 start_codon:yes stop_codon:yes gene_type:complete
MEHKWQDRKLRRAKLFYDHPEICLQIHEVISELVTSDGVPERLPKFSKFMESKTPWKYKRADWDQETAKLFLRIGILRYELVHRDGRKAFRVAPEFRDRLQLTHVDKLSTEEAIEALKLCICDYENYYQQWKRDDLLMESMDEVSKKEL